MTLRFAGEALGRRLREDVGVSSSLLGQLLQLLGEKALVDMSGF